MVERLLDLGHLDGAHRAQVLGDDDLRSQVSEGAGVQTVDVLPGVDPGPDLGVDLARAQPLGQGGIGDYPAGVGLGREVALEGDPDHRVTGAHGEEDLGGRGQQRHDAHVPSLGVAGYAGSGASAASPVRNRAPARRVLSAGP